MKMTGYVVLMGLVLLLGSTHRADDSSPKPTVIATFSIAAVDPETGESGAAVASKFPAVGKVVAHARSGVGAYCTQHYDIRKSAPQALDLLADKKTPEETIFTILKDDKFPGMRQLAIIDMQGRSAQHHPTTAPAGSNYWGGMSGKFYVCQGNTLNGREVIVAMGKAYEETKGSLADRLMAALIAADCAGGDHRGRLAAGIRVCKKDTEGYWLDLHVDKSDDAVVELHKNYVESDHPARGAWGKQKYEHPCPNRPAPKRP
ncbi:MAG: DUF1028 domain-containing protein [Gemmataceae bacterium]|nr:DUF1028 domain-containing protein [Gemmataceae bacterium]